MSVAAAVLYSVGVVVLFGLRSWQHQRATGSHGFNGFTADRGSAARVAGLCFAAAVLGGLTSPVLAAASVLPVHSTGLTASALGWVGTVLTLAGFGLAVVAQQAMGQSWRIGVDPTERTELITSGVFATVRNPIFTAIIIAQAGTTLMAPTWLALSGLALLVIGIELQVRHVEEPYLHDVHGNNYPTYAAHTGRFLPSLGRLTRPAPTAHTISPPRLG